MSRTLGDELEGLMATASYSTELQDRLRGLGYELQVDVFGDLRAKPPYETVFFPVARCLADLELIGDDAAAALHAMCMMGAQFEAWEMAMEMSGRAFPYRACSRAS